MSTSQPRPPRKGECEPASTHEAHLALNGECPNCGGTGEPIEFNPAWTPEQVVDYVERLYST